MVKNKNTTAIVVMVVLAAVLVLTGMVAVHYAGDDRSGEISVDMEYISIAGKNFSVKVPESFTLLEDSLKNKKYSGDVPDIVFSNDNATVNLAVSISGAEMSESQVGPFRNHMDNVMESMGCRILSSEEYQVDGHTVANMRFISQAADGEIYNNMAFFSEDGKMTAISFNCTEELREQWQETGDEMIESLVFI